MSLPITCTQLYQEFEMGNFVAQILGRQFSGIYFGQANEQSNNTIKFIIGPIDFVKVGKSREQKLSNV